MKSTKEKILFPTMIALMISEFVIIYLFASAMASESASEGTYAGIAVVIWVVLMIVYVIWVAERDKRRLTELQDSITNAVMEFYGKKITMEVEKGLGKTKKAKK